MDRKKRAAEKPRCLKPKHKIVSPRKEVLKKSTLQKSSSSRLRELVYKRRNFRLQDEESDEDLLVHETVQSFSPNTSDVRQVPGSSGTTRNQYEDHQDLEYEVDSDTYMSDSSQEENIGSTSHGCISNFEAFDQ